MIVRTKHGFSVLLPKGRLDVENLATFTGRRFGHVVSLTTGRRKLEVYASATGKLRVFDVTKPGKYRELNAVNK
jgi:hypothetical protein